jgi:4-hydroxybenzoate polyprenyltransferase
MTNENGSLSEQNISFARRWIIYQRERFPLAGHVPLVAAFSISAICFSSLLRGDTSFPKLATIVIAFLGSLFFFLQLRIADEFKDAKEDAMYRPYRAVPRGLVTLRQLGFLGIMTAIIQMGLTIWLYPPLVIWLLLTWGYLGLMSKEFFVGDWLRSHPFTYMWTHMLIMPLIDVYTSACDWLPAGVALPGGLKWFLVASFFNGMVIEVGRKIRAPEMEEHGVQTYTVIWGRKGAIFAWLLAMALTLVSALLGAAQINFVTGLASILGVMICLSIIVGLLFVRHQTVRLAKLFEPLSAIWTIALYLGIGVIPLLLHK